MSFLLPLVVHETARFLVPRTGLNSIIPGSLIGKKDILLGFQYYASLKTMGSPGFSNVNWPFPFVLFVDCPCLSLSMFLIAA